MTDYKNDIEKYLKGELTPSQMHALEKKALTDPFLADALEGAQQLSPDDFTADLQQLQTRLNKSVNKKNNVWLWPSRIAAGLLFLVVTSYLIISQLNSTRESRELALNEQEEISSAEESVDSDSPVLDTLAPRGENLLSLQTPQENQADEKTKSPDKVSKGPANPPEQSLGIIASESQQPGAPVITPPDQELSESEDASKPIVSEEKIAMAKPAQTEFSPDKADAAKKRESDRDDIQAESARRKSIAGGEAKSQSYRDKSSRKIIHGKVTFSDDGTGLPGVNVLLKGTNEGVVTDAYGNYQIAVDDPQADLLFSFIGFTSKEVKASGEELNVQLDTDVSELSEVVVVGYGSKELGDISTAPPVMELATPSGGRKAFKLYLEQNLQYPELALKNQVEGKVTIQFNIGTSGQLSDFKVVRGIGFGCDEEVIRLIKTGPKWSPTKRNEEPVRDRVKVRMKFALPKK